MYIEYSCSSCRPLPLLRPGATQRLLCSWDTTASPTRCMSAVNLSTTDEVPEHLRSLECDGWHVDVHKSTYPANNPSEDRSSIVFTGNDSIFAGVWDGHGKISLVMRL